MDGKKAKVEHIRACEGVSDAYHFHKVWIEVHKKNMEKYNEHNEQTYEISAQYWSRMMDPVRVPSLQPWFTS